MAVGAAALLSGCYGSTVVRQPTPRPSSTPTIAPTASPSPVPSPSPKPTATPTVNPSATPSPVPTPTVKPTATPVPQIIHIGFQLGETTDPTYGPIWYYGQNDKQAAVIMVASGSQVIFENDQPASSGIQHTAGGFGSSGFPQNNDNMSPFTQAGSTIDSSLTWSTGILNPGQQSQVFTIGAPGVYYFGCGFHYAGVPTKSNESMGDVLVAQ